MRSRYFIETGPDGVGMLGVLWVLVSVVLVLGSVLGVYEYRAYTAEQLSRAPLLSKVHLAGVVLAGAVGIGVLAWTLLRGFEWWFATLVSVTALLVVLVQRRMHRKMGVERSPLVERFG